MHAAKCTVVKDVDTLGILWTFIPAYKPDLSTLHLCT